VARPDLWSVFADGDAPGLNQYVSYFKTTEPASDVYSLQDQAPITVRGRHNGHANVLYADGHVGDVVGTKTGLPYQLPPPEMNLFTIQTYAK